MVLNEKSLKFGAVFFFVCLISFSYAAEQNKKLESSTKKIQGGRILNNSQKAKMILDKALRTDFSFFSERSFKKNDMGLEQLCKEKIWKKFYKDGSFAERIESTLFDSKGKVLYKTVELMLPDGSIWCLIDKSALKKIYASKKVMLIKKKERALKKKFSHSIKEGTYKKIPCFIVTVNYPKNGVVGKIFKKVFYIDKKDFFIYSANVFMTDGTVVVNKIGKINKIKSDDINDELFEIPADSRIINCDRESVFKSVLYSLRPDIKSFKSSDFHNYHSCCN